MRRRIALGLLIMVFDLSEAAELRVVMACSTVFAI